MRGGYLDPESRFGRNAELATGRDSRRRDASEGRVRRFVRSGAREGIDDLAFIAEQRYMAQNLHPVLCADTHEELSVPTEVLR